jgi:hypothetical protein
VDESCSTDDVAHCNLGKKIAAAAVVVAALAAAATTTTIVPNSFSSLLFSTHR